MTVQRDDRGQRGAVLVLPNGVELELQARCWIIGRHPDCQVVLADPEASRRHAEVRAVPGGYVLVDLGSTNGTKVAGSDVREHPLADGDEIVVGGTVLLFRAGAPSTAKPRTRPATLRGVIGTTALRVLDVGDVGDLEAVHAVLDRDPVSNVFVSSRVRLGLERSRMGGELWGWVVDGRLDALCFAGANLVPVEAGPEAIAAFADRARRQGRRCSSIVGPVEMVEPLWRLLEPSWGPARAIRSRQPVMAIDADPVIAADPLVRAVRPDELDVLYPAAVAMFTEEVGVSPVQGDPNAYRSRVRELDRLGSRLRADRERPGGLQGRARGRERPRLSGAGRLGQPGGTRPGSVSGRHRLGGPPDPTGLRADRLPLRQ